MNAEQLSAIAGVILSLGFSYIPKLKQWFESKESDVKQAIMGLALVIVACAVFGLSCAGVFDTVACTQTGFVGFAGVLVSALVSNQATYLITRK